MSLWANLLRLSVKSRFAVEWQKVNRGVSLVSDVVIRRPEKDLQVINTLLLDGVPVYATSFGYFVDRDKKKRVQGFKVKGMFQTALTDNLSTYIRCRLWGEWNPWFILKVDYESKVRPQVEYASFAVHSLQDADDTPIKPKTGPKESPARGRINLLGRQGFAYTVTAPGEPGSNLVWADRELPEVIHGLTRPELIDFLNLNMHRLPSNTLIHFSNEEIFSKIVDNLKLGGLPCPEN